VAYKNGIIGYIKKEDKMKYTKRDFNKFLDLFEEVKC